MGHGFIHDKLEIKFLILYITARVIEPIPFEVVLDLTLCDDAIDYFDFSECLNDLVKTGHLTLSEEGLYAITEKGLKNSQICESSLPYSVRLRCDKNLAECNRRLRRKNQVQSSYQKRENGTYTVRFFLSDDMGSIMDLQLMATREDMARALRERFLKDPEKIYGQIMQMLLRDEEDEETAPWPGKENIHGKDRTLYSHQYVHAPPGGSGPGPGPERPRPAGHHLSRRPCGTGGIPGALRHPGGL